MKAAEGSIAEENSPKTQPEERTIKAIICLFSVWLAARCRVQARRAVPWYGARKVLHRETRKMFLGKISSFLGDSESCLTGTTCKWIAMSQEPPPSTTFKWSCWFPGGNICVFMLESETLYCRVSWSRFLPPVLQHCSLREEAGLLHLWHLLRDCQQKCN